MKDSNTKIKCIKRNPEKFDVLDLFDAIGRDKKYILGNENDEKAFIDTIRKSLLQNKTPTLIYGKYAETLFANMVASLGKTVLIKKEDSGDIFCNHDIHIPDYRILLNDGTQFLVEVKNHCKNSSFCLKTNYLNSLSRYAKLLKIDLRIAIYWSQWSIWTLITPDDFKYSERKALIDTSSALKRNQMVQIGDYAIGTIPPLSIRIYPDKIRRNDISNNIIEFRINSVELLCGNKKIANKNEQRIALALMLYGNWLEDNIVITSKKADNKLEYIEFSYFPPEYDNQQGFGIVGYLSSIISRQYCHLTAPKGNVVRLSPDIDPETLGFTIPEDYRGTSLPLWRFRV